MKGGSPQLLLPWLLGGMTSHGSAVGAGHGDFNAPLGEGTLWEAHGGTKITAVRSKL